MKKSRLKLAIYLIIPIAIVGYYQVKLSSFSGIKYVECYQVKPNTTITKGTELNANMFTQPVLLNKNNVSDQTVKSLQGIETKVALENLYGSEVLITTKIQEEKKWDTIEDRYVSVTSNDSFGGSDVRPGDTVDLFVYDNLTKQYTKQANNLLVLNIKDKDGTYYADGKNSKFLPSIVYFKDTNDGFKTIIDKLVDSGNKVELSIHGNRPNTKNTAIDGSDSSNILNMR